MIIVAGASIFRWITLIAVLFWLVVYWHGGKKVLVDIRASIRSGNSRLDGVLLIVLSLCSAGVIGAGVFVNLGLTEMILSQNPIIVFVGTIFTISGIAGMFYCRHYLGRFWTAETNLSKEHQIIDTGPYHTVRHPIYTFAILMYIGLELVFLSLWTVSLTGVTIVAYVLKAKDEDHYLEQNLPGYCDYQSRVRYRLIPGLW
ncbi:MAG: isoprenylcysteine carboxylmethyltransferase family protein [Anaerolineae bacterium]|nr:isoprenylcysteine carboxylmethyltransferase family protein [Anaerolineae bacterium]